MPGLKQLPVTMFAVKGSALGSFRRIVTLPIELNFTTRIIHNIRVLVLYICISRVMPVVMETSVKILRLAGS